MLASSFAAPAAVVANPAPANKAIAAAIAPLRRTMVNALRAVEGIRDVMAVALP
jgi:hypothetical protein